jgi:histidine ammonia-lyase
MHLLFDFSRPVTVEEIISVAGSDEKIVMDETTRSRIEASRNFLDEKSARSTSPIYGVNTGFGSLCNSVIDSASLTTLQENLLRSHACGTGEEVPQEIVRLMLLLKVRGLAYGYSGVSSETVQRLLDFVNLGITPVVYQQGSLGASGDLAPLAHLALPLIGEGEVYYRNTKQPAASALKAAGLKPVILQSKEGLALINGTQFMSAYAVWCVSEALRFADKSCLIAAMSLDAYDGRTEPFDDAIHRIRPHDGQRTIASLMRKYLSGSSIAAKEKTQVQDPYSFRCIPQVAGASLDAIHYAKKVVETEINSVTDNPLVIAEEDKVISGGNFHGQPLALVLDFLAIALAELGSISERRTYKLIGGQRGLPPYLAPDAGLNSGLMIPQYTAASLVSQNKQLCTPSSVDSIDSSNGQEDHVSMGANGATKCYRVLQNVRSIFAIELLTASQALEFRRPLTSSPQVESLHAEVRKILPFISKDIYLSEPINLLRALI